MLSPCSCGETRPHVILRRRTADGIDVCLWDDGVLGGAVGMALRGVPVRRPRTPEAAHHARRAGALLLGEVDLYDAAELPDLYAAAEGAARRDGLPSTLRRLLRERQERQARPPLVWTVRHTDRDGRPTERIARLNRIQWPGLAVFDFCGGPGSAQGRYRLFHLRRTDRRFADEVCEDTGWAFRNLADLWAHLDSVKASL